MPTSEETKKSDDQNMDSEKEEGKDTTTAPPRPERSVVHHDATTIGGHKLAYTATAATVNLRDEARKDRASLFTVSYILQGKHDPATRPVTFCFNGGPGSSSVWLHYGAFGPRRIDVPDTVPVPPPPYVVRDNPHGLLDLTDLVFIDPVGTGFSRPVGTSKAEDYHAIDPDIESVGELIRRWLDRNGRWSSPKLLAGESYGTTRAAGLAGWLQEAGVTLNGLALISLATDFQNFVFEPGNDLPSILYLPAYTAVAWYHRRLPQRPDELQPLLDKVRRFALEEYAPALLQGSRLDPARKHRLARRLHRYTGLPTDDIERRELRIDNMWFARTVLGPGPDGVGRLDARYVGPDLDLTGLAQTRDPSFDAAMGAFTAVVNDDLRRTLGWEEDEPYHVLSSTVNQGWKWERKDHMGFPSTTADLRAAMIANPHLKVLFCNGLFDLATPFFAAEHTADHLGLPASLRDNVQVALYEAGHMMYFHPPSRVKLKADLANLYARAVPPR